MRQRTVRGRGQAAWAAVIAGTALSVLSGAAAAEASSSAPAAQRASAQLASYNPGADQKDMVAEVHDSMCATDPDGQLHTSEWYAAVDSWQAVTPYELKKAISPSAMARNRLWQDPRLNALTLTATCDNLTLFGDALRTVILDLKGPLKPGCATEQGMSAFYDYKLEVFRAIDDHNWPKVTTLMPGWRDPAHFPQGLTHVTCTQLSGVARY